MAVEMLTEREVAAARAVLKAAVGQTVVIYMRLHTTAPVGDPASGRVVGLGSAPLAYKGEVLGLDETESMLHLRGEHSGPTGPITAEHWIFLCDVLMVIQLGRVEAVAGRRGILTAS